MMPVTISVGCLKTAGTVVGVEDDLTAPVSSADMGCGKLWRDFALWSLGLDIGRFGHAQFPCHWLWIRAISASVRIVQMR